jgi:hypothetical protein
MASFVNHYIHMTDQIHSPFHVIENFFSPLQCEKLIEEFGISTPSYDENSKPLKHERLLHDGAAADAIKAALSAHIGAIEDRYTAKTVRMDVPKFCQYFEDPKNPCETHGCENAKFLRKKWVKTKDVDLVAYVWLKDYGAGVPLDPRYEVYGGKLEFPAYNFSLVPQRGTCVIFPAGPHFISAISPVLVGSLEQVKFSIKVTNPDDTMFHYQPANFPGSYVEWFNEQA